jgi:uncharacterized protein (TIGR03083 family)
MPVDEDAAIVAERSSLYETLKTLSAADWNHPSLCEGWRVRDVATHVETEVTIGLLRLVGGLIVNRGDFNRFMASYVPGRANRAPEEILAAWSGVATSAKVLPTAKKVDVALDCFVHHHDICVPLGREVAADSERLRWMADGMVAAKKPIGSGPRVEGLRLIATDIDWHYGTGPEAQGPAAALVLAGCGRVALENQLSGEGAAELIRRR